MLAVSSSSEYFPDLVSSHESCVYFPRVAGAETRKGNLDYDSEFDCDLRLVLCVTCYRRNDDLVRQLAAIEPFFKKNRNCSVFIVDHSCTLRLAECSQLKVFPAKNLGGSGGFARALSFARAEGFTHAIFMDDDAVCSAESLQLTYEYLCGAKSPNTAVAGAMVSSSSPTLIREYGAHFFKRCWPLHGGTDLNDPHAVAQMEVAKLSDDPTILYGGFWFFAFPIAHVTSDPFPYFVRGDDIAFSLSNDFDIQRLPGVFSIQEDFSIKESPATLYLDMRSHLHHHLVHERLEIGRLGTLHMVARFVGRQLRRMHYESAWCLLRAWSDIMEGPEFFERNLEFAPQLEAMRNALRSEAWRSFEGEIPSKQPEVKGLRRQLARLSLHGYLVPFFGFWGAHRCIPISQRQHNAVINGAARVTIVNEKNGQSYTVQHNKWQAAKILASAAWLTARWFWLYPRMRAAHREGYYRMTRPEFWQEVFRREEELPQE